MAVRFVIGRAGSGKTKRIFDAIVEEMRAEPIDGPPIYWILPKQATFSAERDLTTLSGLGGFCRARILSFDWLGEEVLSACGGRAVAEISAIGRQMLLGFLLRRNQDQLKFFRSVAQQPGLAARLDATFAEFERCGKNPDDLAGLLQDLDATEEHIERALLRDKVSDFHLLYRAYRDVLGQERVDPHRRLEQVLSCIRDHKPLRGATVYIDGFLEFTERERRIIAALATVAARVEITVLADANRPTVRDVHHLPDELDVFYPTLATYRMLRLALEQAGARIEPPVLLESTPRFAAPALEWAEKRLFGEERAFEGRPDAVELVEAPDGRGEVDAAARRIRELLRQGRRMRDIAVLVRDIDDYEPLIFASFREHGISYFVDRRRTATHHPLLQFLRSLLQIARQDWPHDAMMSLLKTGLAGMELDQVEELENYVLLHRIRSTAWSDRKPWVYCRVTTRGGEDDEQLEAARIDAARMDGLRRSVVDKLIPFIGASAKPRTVREIVVDLFQLFRVFGVRDALATWIDRATAQNEVEQAGEHQQVWEELSKLFDQMVDLLGNETVAPGDFVEILEAGLEQFDLALAPPRVDQVLVGQVDRTRNARAETAFVLGLSEGQFPRIVREDSVLSDAERRSFRKHQLDIDPDSERKLLDENLLGYLAFTRSSKRLIVTRPVSSNSKPVGPSALWLRLMRVFPTAMVTSEKREPEAPPEAIATPRQLVTALMRWARGADDAKLSQQPWPALYQWLAGHACCNDAVDVMRYKAWRALGYDNSASLSAEIAAMLTGDRLHASVSRLEAFAACPFQHFAKYHLGLSPREEADVTAMDMGTVYHQILEGVVRRTLKLRADWCKVEKQVTATMISDLADEAGRSLRGELMLSNARNKYLLDRIRRNIEQVCASHKEMLSRGDFRPVLAEVEFGGEQSALGPLELQTPRGRRILLRGKIDRVDQSRDGGEVAVIDYKMANRRLALHEVYHGLSLQLLTYLLVLDAQGKALFGKPVTAVAAFYSRLLRDLESVDHPDDAPDPSDPEFDLRTKPRGIVDARHVPKFDAALSTGSSSVIAVHVNKDGNFGRLDSTDIAESRQFAALLAYVKKRIGELADQMIDGAIESRPYRIGKITPCSHCDYRSVCRFDPAINPYMQLAMLKRTEVLQRVVEEGGGK